MRRSIFQVTLVLLVIAAAGCAMVDGQRNAASGRKTFSSLQAAVVEASAKAKGTVALVKLQGSGIGSQKAVMSSDGRIVPGEKASIKNVTGLILTNNGYLVIAEPVNPSGIERVEAWIGDNEYRARIVKSDNHLGMTVIKMELDEPVKFLDIEKFEDLLVGDWCVGVQPSDESCDYEELTSISLCRGQTAGRYREFLLDNGEISEGSPVLGLSGNVIGIVHKRGRVLAMSDIRDDLLSLLGEAAGVKSADEEAKQKAWFGALMSPVNKEYANKHGLSKSCIWVNYVTKGSPADMAGIKNGDLMQSVNGCDMRLTGNRALEYLLKALHPKVGQSFRVAVLRDGKIVELSGTFTKEPQDETVRAADLGVTVKNIDDGDVVKGNLFAGEGVLVTDIERGGAASVGSSMRSGLLNKGDIITQIGGTPTPDIKTFSTVLEKLRRERAEIMLVKYLRGRATGYAALNLKIGENGKEGGNK